MGRLNKWHWCLRETSQSHLTEKVKGERVRWLWLTGELPRMAVGWQENNCIVCQGCVLYWDINVMWLTASWFTLCHTYRQCCIVYGGCYELPSYNLSFLCVDWWEFLGSFGWQFLIEAQIVVYCRDWDYTSKNWTVWFSNLSPAT